MEKYIKLSEYAKSIGVKYMTASAIMYGLRRSKRKTEKIIAELKKED